MNPSLLSGGVQQAYIAFALVLLESFLCPCLVTSVASGDVGTMQTRGPVNFAGSRHDARFPQEAHDSESLKKKAMQAAKAEKKRGKTNRSAQLHGLN